MEASEHLELALRRYASDAALPDNVRDELRAIAGDKHIHVPYEEWCCEGDPALIDRCFLCNHPVLHRFHKGVT